MSTLSGFPPQPGVASYNYRDNFWSASPSDFNMFLMEILKGNVSGYTYELVAGHLDNVGTARADVWDEGGAYVYPSDSGTTMTISSSSVNDTSAGSGAQTVTVWGLDANWGAVTETATMNGKTAVNLVNTYSRINKLCVATAGASGWNEGNIYIGAQSDTLTNGKPNTNVYARIIFDSIGATSFGENCTLSSLRSIPSDKTAFILSPSFYSNGAKDIETWVYSRLFGSVFIVDDRMMKRNAPLVPPESFMFTLPAKSDIAFRAAASASTDVAITYGLILVDTDSGVLNQ